MPTKKDEPPVFCSRSLDSFNNDHPSKCAVLSPHAEIKSTATPSSNLPQCNKCVASGMHIYQNAYECKINGGTVKFIQRICVPNPSRQEGHSSDAKQSQLVDNDKPPTKQKYDNNENVEHSPQKQSPAPDQTTGKFVFNNRNVGHSTSKTSLIAADQKHEVLILKDNARTNDNVVIQKDKKSERNRSLTEIPGVYKPGACKVCESSYVEKSQLVDSDKLPTKPKDDINNKNEELLSPKQSFTSAAHQKQEVLVQKDEASADYKVVKPEETQPEIESLTAADQTVRECSDVEESQPVHSYKLPINPKDDNNKNAELLSRKQSLTAAHEDHTVLIRKDNTTAECKLVKHEEIQPKREKSLTKQHTSSLIVICEPNASTVSQSSNVEKSQLADSHRLTRKPKCCFIFNKSNADHTSTINCFTAADQTVCECSDVEESQPVHSYKLPINPKDDNNKNAELLSRKQSLTAANEDHKVLIRKDNTTAECNLVKHEEIQPKREKSLTKQHTSSSIVICEPNASTVSQSSNVEKSQLVDSHRLTRKPKCCFIFNKSNADHTSTINCFTAAEQTVCECSDVEESQPVHSYKLPINPKDNNNKNAELLSRKQSLTAANEDHKVLIRKDNTTAECKLVKHEEIQPKREKSLTKQHTSSSIVICEPNACTVCQSSLVKESQLVDSHRSTRKPKCCCFISNKNNVEHTSTKKSLTAADQTVCECSDVEESQPVHSYKLPINPKDNNNKNAELLSRKRSLIAANEDHKVLIRKDNTTAERKLVKHGEIQPKREKSLTKQHTSSSIVICKPNACTVCQSSNVEKFQLVDSHRLTRKPKCCFIFNKSNADHTSTINCFTAADQTVCECSDVEESQPVHSYKLPINPKDNNNKNAELLSRKQSLTAAHEDHNVLIRKDNTTAERKLVKHGEIQPKREKSLTKQHTSSSIVICEPNACRVCQSSNVEKSQLVDNHRSTRKPTCCFIFNKSNVEHTSTKKSLTAADQEICECSDVEESQPIDSYKLPINLKHDNNKNAKLLSPIQSITAAHQDQKVHIRENNTASDCKVVKQEEILPKREKSLTKQHPSVSIGICEPNLCTACQNLNIEKSQLVDSQKSTKQTQCCSVYNKRNVEQSATKKSLGAAERKHEVLILKNKALAKGRDPLFKGSLAKGNVVKRKYTKLESKRSLAEKPDRSTRQSKCCFISNKNNVEHTSTKKSLTAAVQKLCECSDVEKSQPVHSYKLPINPKDNNNKNAELLSRKQSLTAAHGDQDVLIRKDDTAAECKLVKHTEIQPKRERSLTKQHTSSSIVIYRSTRKPTCCFIFNKSNVEHTSTQKSFTAADQTVCECSDVEESQPVDSYKLPINPKHDNNKNAKLLFPKQSLTAAHQDQEVHIRQNNTAADCKVVKQEEIQPKSEKSLTKQHTSSSIVICEPNICTACQNSNMEKSQLVDSHKSTKQAKCCSIYNKRNVEHSATKKFFKAADRKHEVLVVKGKALAKGKDPLIKKSSAKGNVVKRKDRKLKRKRSLAEKPAVCEPNPCKVCESSLVKKSQLVDSHRSTRKPKCCCFISNKNNVEHTSTKKSRTAADQKVCECSDVEESQPVVSHKLPINPKDDSNKNAKRLSPKQSLTAAHEVLIRKAHAAADCKVVKQEKIQPKKEKSLTKQHPPVLIGIYEPNPCTACQKSNIEKSQLVDSRKSTKNPKCRFIFNKRNMEDWAAMKTFTTTNRKNERLILKDKALTKDHTAIRKYRTLEGKRNLADRPEVCVPNACKGCDSSDVEKSQLIDSDKLPTKPKDDINKKIVELLSPKQCLTAAHQNQEVLVQEYETPADYKVVKQPEIEKSLTKQHTSSSIGIREPNACIVCQNSNVEKSHLVDSHRSTRSVAVANQKHEVLIMKDRAVTKVNAVIQKDKSGRGKRLIDRSGILEPNACKVCECSDVEKSQLVDSDKLPTKSKDDINNTHAEFLSPKQSVVAEYQNHELFLLNDKILAKDNVVSNACICQNSALEQSLMVHKDKPPTKPKTDLKFNNKETEQSLRVAHDSHEVVLRKDKAATRGNAGKQANKKPGREIGLIKKPMSSSKEICKCNAGKQICKNFHAEASYLVHKDTLSEKPKGDTKTRNKTVEHPSPKKTVVAADQNHELLILKDKTLDKDNIVSNACICQSSDLLEQFVVVDNNKPPTKFNNKNIEDPSSRQSLIGSYQRQEVLERNDKKQAKQKAVKQKDKKPRKAKSLTNQPTSSSIKICEINACKQLCQNWDVEAAHLVNNGKPLARSKEDTEIKNKTVEHPFPKQSLVAADQNHELLLLKEAKEETLVRINVVSIDCICQKLDLEQSLVVDNDKPLIKPKGDKKPLKDKLVKQKDEKPGKETGQTTKLTSSWMGICESNACKQVCKNLDLEALAKPKDYTKVKNKTVQHPSPKQSVVAADQNHELLILKDKTLDRGNVASNVCICQSSDLLEQFVVVDNNKLQTKPKGEIEFNNKNVEDPSSRQSLIGAHQNQKVLERNDKTQAKEKALKQKDKEPRKAKSLTNQPTSSSIKICEINACKQLCQNWVVEAAHLVNNGKPLAKPKVDTEIKNKTVEHPFPKQYLVAADQNYKVLIPKEKTLARDKLLIQEDKKTGREKCLTKAPTSSSIGICESNVCKQVCQNSDVEALGKPKGPTKIENKTIQHPSPKQSLLAADQNYEVFIPKEKLSKNKLLIQEDKKPRKEKGLTKAPTSSSIGICESSACKQLCQNSDVEALAKPKGETKIKNKTIQYPSPKQSLVAADQNYEVFIPKEKLSKAKALIEKDEKLRKEKGLTRTPTSSTIAICECNACKQVCQNSDVDALAKLKGDTKNKNKTIHYPSLKQSLVAADQDYEVFIPKEKLSKNKLLIQEDKKPRNEKGLTKAPTSSSIGICESNACKQLCQNSNLEAFAKPKGDTKIKNKTIQYPSPKQSLLAADQNYEVFIPKEKTLAKDKVLIQDVKKPGREKGLTKAPTSSSIGICEPNVCKQVCQNSDVEALRKLKGHTKIKNKTIQHPSPKQSLVAADQDYEVFIPKEKLSKNKLLIQEDKKPRNEKGLTKAPTSSSIGICESNACKQLCQNSNLEALAKPKGDTKIKNKTIQYPSPKQSLVAANQNYVVFIPKEKTLAKDKVLIQEDKKPRKEKGLTMTPTSSSIAICESNACRQVCQNSDVKASAKPKSDTKIKNTTIQRPSPKQSLVAAHQNHELLLLKEAEEETLAKSNVVSIDCICQNSDLEQSLVIDNDKSLIKPKDDKTLVKGKVVKQKDEKLEKEEGQTTKLTSSSIGICESNACKQVCQNSDVEALAKPKGDTKIKNKTIQHPTPEQSLVAADQNYEVFIPKEKLSKAKVLIQGDEKLRKEKGLTKTPTSASIAICESNACKQVCQNSELEALAKPKGDTKVKNTTIQHPTPKQSLVAADQIHELLLLKEANEGTSAKSNVGSIDCICQNLDLKQSLVTDNDKSLIKPKDDKKPVKGRVVKQKHEKPGKEKGLTTKLTSSSIGICESNACKHVCQNSDVEALGKPKGDTKIKNKTIQNPTPEQSLVAADQTYEVFIPKEKLSKAKALIEEDEKLRKEKGLTKTPTSSSIAICECNACKQVCQNSDVDALAKLKGDTKIKNKTIHYPSLKQSLVAADLNDKTLILKNKTVVKDNVSDAYVCENSDLEQSLAYNNMHRTEGDIKFENKNVEYLSPKQSLIAIEEESNKVHILKDLASEKPVIVTTNDKKARKEKSLTKRPTFSSIGFLMKHLERFKNPKLTKTEIAKYKKTNRAGDSPSAGELPKFGLYGTKEKKLFNYGEIGSGTKSKGEVQDFYKLRDFHLNCGTLFEDPEFLPIDDSVYYTKRLRPPTVVQWKRPGELVENPRFFVDGYSRFDVKQGYLGDCWLLAAIGTLTLNRKLFFQVVPADQGFDENYAGIFHFRFWRYGRWIDVVVDDKLPSDSRGKLLLMHSAEVNEFWSALLEKAYAKLHGSYEALKGGSTCDSMVDFTGGIAESYDLTTAVPPNLFKIILKGYERCSLFTASIKPLGNVIEQITPQGLVCGHAYSISKAKYVDIQTPNVVGKIALLRVRNPWGDEAEWNGAWSDQSPEWRFMSDDRKQKLGLTFDSDGEYWMSFKDFVKYFDGLEICNLPPDLLTEEQLIEGHKKEWKMSVFEGEWVSGVTAGGCPDFLDTFWMNPQYRITLREPDEGDSDNRCTIIVGLMQKHRRAQRRIGLDYLIIGFSIFFIPNPNREPKHLDIKFFNRCRPVGSSPIYTDERESCYRFRLPPGTYCIVPCTLSPHTEGEFILRVFSEHTNNMEENEEEFRLEDADDMIFQDPLIIKNVPKVEQAEHGDNAKELFFKLAGDDMEIGWIELKQILDSAMQSELSGSGFSKDICRSMIAMIDTDRSGTIGYTAFRELWVDIRKWKLVFKMYDKNNAGVLSDGDLRNAFQSAGYHLNNHILNILMHRYGNNKGEIELNEFIMSAVKLKTLRGVYKKKNPYNTGDAKFSLDEWMENAT